MNNCAVQFDIGVDEYAFMLPKACSLNPSLVTHLQFSFRLSGNFWHAAYEDDISKTIDYDALSSFIHQRLATKDCGSLPQFLPTIKSLIQDYSPLIADGHLFVSFNCHDAFRFEIDLL